MLSKLRSIVATDKDNSDQLAEHQLRIAAAVLLIEVARADFAEHGVEYTTLTHQIKERFNLADEVAEQVVSDAIVRSDDTVSLHEDVDLINKHFPLVKKVELLRSLWDVAYADEKLHHY